VSIFLVGKKAVFVKVKNKKYIYQVVLWALLIISIILFTRIAPILTVTHYINNDDFVRYWAGGKLNVHGENPYELARIIKLQEEVGVAESEVTNAIVLNPPWAITLLMPFGLLDYYVGRLSWLFLSIALILLSAVILWRIYSGNPKHRWFVILIVFIFAPTISVLEKGQIAAFILIGTVAFVYFASVDRNDWMAGISLAIIAIKPQLLLLFWIALLFWIVQQRRWKILISIIITILSLTLVAIATNQYIIQQYLNMLQTYQISDWASPTIGSYIRYFWFETKQFWLQFLPVVLGGIWLTYYWYRHHDTWNWLNELPIILLISMVLSPYSWTYDLVVLVPAVALAAIWIATDWKNWTTPLMVFTFFGITILDLVLHMKLDEFWFIWVAPALLIWFLLVRWLYPKSQKKQYIPPL
jgi:hypothetical protein